MEDLHYAALSRLINDHVRLGPSRRETIIELLAAIPKAGTVNLNRLAPHIESKAKTASVYRRLERFFSEVRLNDAEVAQTCGFNLEATHITDPAKLSTLIALLTLAAAFACKAGLALASITPIRRKMHGRSARSLFAYGLDAIRKIFAPRRFSEVLQIVLVGLTGGTRQLYRPCAA